MHTDVLIVGGGLSGLALADRLTGAGLDFVVVEAQARLGGRIMTEVLAGGHFDLGPAWFWPGQPGMAGLIQRFSLPVFEQYSVGDLLFQDRSGAIRRERGHAPMQGSYRLGGGMERLIRSLAGALDTGKIVLATPVRSLHLQTARITARLADNRTIEAKRVVLALPPRVAAETIAFEPHPGPEPIAAMRSIPTWMAGQAKIVAVYDRPHWRDAGLSGDAISHRGPMVEIHDASPMEGGPYALFGFIGVPADAREAHIDTMKHLALSQLTTLFGGDMARPFDLVIKDWATVSEVATKEDREAMHSHPPYGLPQELRNIWGGRVHLSSTETAPGFGGYLEGALEAAENTAHALIEGA